MPPTPSKFHSFSRLVLTIADPPVGDVQAEHSIELRATDHGAEIWRASRLHSGGEPCASELRYVGTMTSRQVIDLLLDLERSGIYEAAPSPSFDSLPEGLEVGAKVSMRLQDNLVSHQVLDDVPAEAGFARRVVLSVRNAVAMAQERALSWAG